MLTTTTAAGLNGVFRVIVSPDGNFVYTAAYDSDAVCAFKRSAVDGKLTYSSCYISAVYHDAATDVTLMPDGKHLLASAFNSDGVAVFERNPQSGFINYTEIIAAARPCRGSMARAASWRILPAKRPMPPATTMMPW